MKAPLITGVQAMMRAQRRLHSASRRLRQTGFCSAPKASVPPCLGAPALAPPLTPAADVRRASTAPVRQAATRPLTLALARLCSTQRSSGLHVEGVREALDLRMEPLGELVRE